MLQNIRDKAQGWIAYGIVILISVPFALWGIQEYLGLGSEPVVAKVNGTEITQRAFDTQFHNFQQQMREKLGAAYRPDLFDENRVREQVLDRMVRDTLIEQVSHDMGLRVSDAEVQAALLAIDGFEKNGRLDQEAVKRAARLQGLTPAGLMERMRNALLTQQLAQAVGVSAFVTEHEKAEALRLMNQRREFTYFVVPAADFRVDTPISDDAIKAYYTENQPEFAVAERVKLSYLHLDAKSIGDTVKVTDAELQNYYDGNQEKFGLPEQRRVRHILIKVAPGADQKTVEEASSRIEALAKKLAQGEDFAALAKTSSEDSGTAAAGGDLGYFAKGVMDPAFEAAAFALAPGQISAPVRSRFGFHLIKLVDIKLGGVKPFAQAKPEVERTYRKEEGERLYFEMAERLADLAYDNPASLEPAAEALGLTVQHSDWVTREHADGILASPKVLNAAFSEDVLVAGNNSEPIELDAESSLVLRVDEHEEATTRPLSEVRERIVENLQRQRAEAQAEAEADKRRKGILGGGSLAQAAGDYPVSGPLKVARTDRSAPAELIAAVFASPKPAAAEPTVGSVRLSNGDMAVFALQAVQEGDAGEGEKSMLLSLLSREMERTLYTELVADLKSHANIEILLQQNEDE